MCLHFFYEIPSMILEVIKETKRYGRTVERSVGRTRTDNMKTVYPPTNTVCGGYNHYKACFRKVIQDHPEMKELLIKCTEK